LIKFQQGESIAMAFENIAKAAHLNLNKAATNVTGPTLTMKAAVFSRIGLARLAWSSCETFLECYADEAPVEDLLKCRCRMASLLVHKGRYSEATELMEAIPRHVVRVVKYQQYWTFFAGMLRLRRHLHRSDFDAASYILEQLKGQGAPDIEVGFTLSLLEVNLFMRRGVYNEALDLVESLAKKTHTESTDIYAQIKLLMIKARGLALCNHPLKGFSIAVRAANMANRARILPALWEAAGILANILINLHEFAAAVDVLEAIVPQVLQCEDCDFAARTYALLVDGYMGLGGEEEPHSAKREERINNAMQCIDSAFAQFKHVEDLRGQCDMLVKKATVLNLRGDLVLANDCASQYLELKKEYKAARL
jgi:anaphase-promoting complex subunit 5